MNLSAHFSSMLMAIASIPRDFVVLQSARIPGTRISATDGTERHVLVKMMLVQRHSDSRILLRIAHDDAISGYESWYWDHNLIESLRTSEWCAWAGTPGRWDELWLDAYQILEVFGHHDVRSEAA